MSATIDITPLTDTCPELFALYSLIQVQQADFWLVGGTIRDLLLGQAPADIDLCCPGDPTSIAKRWSRQVDGRWFWLDQTRKQSRVLLKSGVSLDFAPLRAASLREDQLLRDFTINAIAVPLLLDGSEPALIDPCNGQSDLRNKRIVDCSPRSFPDDPLRMLKGIRHAVSLGFDIAAETEKRIKKNASLMIKTAGERIREEFCRILSDDIAKGLVLLQTTSLLEIVCGINDLAAESVQALQRLDLQLKVLENEGVLIVEEKGTIGTRPLMLFAELLRLEMSEDPKPMLQQRLRLSKHQQQLVIGLQQQIPSAILSMITQLDSPRRQALFFEQLQPFSFEKLLRWGLCCDTVTLSILEELQSSYIDLERAGRVPDLLDGHQLATYLIGDQKKQIGHWLLRIKEAELNGFISSQLVAQKWLEQQLAIDR